ncbi:MAG: N-acetylmuramoyl-L-alanine amidase [Chlorobiales bacterium]|jgi:N-acetyl-anhydromuramyl-L-alanine amidase AmpD|nr:N-acetylmuramoyl-L-alanine amidase [Chlorobiales bacterium]
MPSDPKMFQFDLPPSGRPTDAHIPETWYPGIQKYWPQCSTKRIVHPINGIAAVVIHATAGASSAGAVSVMKEGHASFHWLVPDEDEPQHGHVIWACVPESLAAWHVRNDRSHPDVNGGKNKVNHWSLGIEVVNMQNNRDSFSDWQVAATAKIVRYCWAKYPNLRHVVSHAKLDPQRRLDPGAKFPWDAFKKQVLQSNVLPEFDSLVKAAKHADDIALSEKNPSCCMG